MSIRPVPTSASEFLDDVEAVWSGAEVQRAHAPLCYRWHERCCIRLLLNRLRAVENPEASRPD